MGGWLSLKVRSDAASKRAASLATIKMVHFVTSGLHSAEMMLHIAD